MISCLTVTQPGHLALLERSVDCFVRQDHPEREMVIVHDGGASYHSDILRLVSRRRGHDIAVHREAPGRPLGALRNAALAVAKHPVVCQWDDDDLYHPQRLSIQYQRLRETNGDFCFFTEQLHWFERPNHWYWDDWTCEQPPMHLIQGTLMGRKERGHSAVHGAGRIRLPIDGIV